MNGQNLPKDEEGDDSNDSETGQRGGPTLFHESSENSHGFSWMGKLA